MGTETARGSRRTESGEVGRALGVAHSTSMHGDVGTIDLDKDKVPFGHLLNLVEGCE